jgi:hypothetical protein
MANNIGEIKIFFHRISVQLTNNQFKINEFGLDMKT